jgi:hypothetical protein
MAVSSAALVLAPLLALGLGAPPLPAPPASAAPVAWYQLDGDGRDATGYGADGVVVGARAAEDRTGRAGGALAFSGRDLVDLGSRVEPERLTVMAWVRPGRLFRDGAILSKASPAAGRDRWLELRVDGDGRPALLLPSLDRPLRGPRLLVEGRWSHLAATFDGARAVLFVDGAPVAEAAAPPFRGGPGPALLGARPDPGGRAKKAGTFLEGRLDDVRLYRVALPAWEVLAVVHPASRPPPGGEVADDAADLERIGRLALAFDRAVVRRDAAGLREVEGRVLAEIDMELREARGERRRGERRLAALRHAREVFQAEARQVDAMSLDRKRSALAEVSEAAWLEFTEELEDHDFDGRRPDRRDDRDGRGEPGRGWGERDGWGQDGRRDDPRDGRFTGGEPEAPRPPPPPPPPAGPRAMEQARFDALVAAVRREPFADGQRRVLDTAMPGSWFTVAQLGTLIDLFTFSPDKLAVVRRARAHIVDPDQAFQLSGRFTFESDKAELRKILQP